MSTGEVLRVRAAMKPLSTLVKALDTVDVATGARAKAVVQRSDVTAVPAAGVVAEAVVALVLADALLEKTGGDSLAEVRRNLDAYLTGLGPQADEGLGEGGRLGRDQTLAGPGQLALGPPQPDPQGHQGQRQQGQHRDGHAAVDHGAPLEQGEVAVELPRPQAEGDRGGRAGDEDEQQEPAHLASSGVQSDRPMLPGAGPPRAVSRWTAGLSSP